MLGRVVCGSRTWTWTMAAPAFAASIADWAICCGVTGTAGLRPGESAEPVTAHEIMILRCMLPPLQVSGVRGQESGVRGQGSGVRSQESGVREEGTLPHPPVLISDFFRR